MKGALIPNATVVLAALLTGRQWFVADGLCDTIARLGFNRPTAQALGGRLARLTREECPLFRGRCLYGYNEYRVTGFGRTLLANTFENGDVFP